MGVHRVDVGQSKQMELGASAIFPPCYTDTPWLASRTAKRLGVESKRWKNSRLKRMQVRPLSWAFVQQPVSERGIVMSRSRLEYGSFRSRFKTDLDLLNF